ncbi:MAG: SpoIIE family protein phosphatase [Planctomycetia bacterium]|nr:SpoIIE family protein phosphatase [Planctomycetia bacterium]
MRLPPLVIPVLEANHVGDARRRAVQFAEGLGLDGIALGNLGLIVNELSTNLVKHARDGQLLLQADGDGGLELLALDRGPGMYDVERCFEDGFSTAGSRGMGLSAIRRLASHWDIFSKPDVGTVQLVRVGNRKTFDASRAEYRVRGVSVPHPGETVCGDAWDARVSPTNITVIVADGLGHGIAAHKAASEAIRVFRSLEASTPARQLDEIHQALKATRGAAVSIASLDLISRHVTYAGIGNVVGFIATPESTQRMVSINGTLGCAAPKPREFTYALPLGAVVALYSDGLLTQTGLMAYPGLIGHDPALLAAALYRDFKRGKDDATVVVAST